MIGPIGFPEDAPQGFPGDIIAAEEYDLDALSGSVAVSGDQADLDLELLYDLDALSGSVSAIGDSADLDHFLLYDLDALSGSVAVAGDSADLDHFQLHELDALPGSVSAIGDTADLDHFQLYELDALSGSVDVAGFSADFTRDYDLEVFGGSVSVFGDQADLDHFQLYELDAEPGQVFTAGDEIESILERSAELDALPGAVTVSGDGIETIVDNSLSAADGLVEVRGDSAELDTSSGDMLECEPGIVAVTGDGARVNRHRSYPAKLGPIGFPEIYIEVPFQPSGTQATLDDVRGGQGFGGEPVLVPSCLPKLHWELPNYPLISPSGLPALLCCRVEGRYDFIREESQTHEQTPLPLVPFRVEVEGDGWPIGNPVSEYYDSSYDYGYALPSNQTKTQSWQAPASLIRRSLFTLDGRQLWTIERRPDQVSGEEFMIVREYVGGQWIEKAASPVNDFSPYPPPAEFTVDLTHAVKVHAPGEFASAVDSGATYDSMYTVTSPNVATDAQLREYRVVGNEIQMIVTRDDPAQQAVERTEIVGVGNPEVGLPWYLNEERWHYYQGTCPRSGLGFSVEKIDYVVVEGDDGPPGGTNEWQHEFSEATPVTIDHRSTIKLGRPIWLERNSASPGVSPTEVVSPGPAVDGADVHSEGASATYDYIECTTGDYRHEGVALFGSQDLICLYGDARSTSGYILAFEHSFFEYNDACPPPDICQDINERLKYRRDAFVKVSGTIVVGFTVVIAPDPPECDDVLFPPPDPDAADYLVECLALPTTDGGGDRYVLVWNDPRQGEELGTPIDPLYDAPPFLTCFRDDGSIEWELPYTPSGLQNGRARWASDRWLYVINAEFSTDILDHYGIDITQFGSHSQWMISHVGDGSGWPKSIKPGGRVEVDNVVEHWPDGGGGAAQIFNDCIKRSSYFPASVVPGRP